MDLRIVHGKRDRFRHLVSEIGDFSGEVVLREGASLLSVTAHGGRWTMTAE